MLTDRIRIFVKAGKGADGKISFGINKKPNGGDGGKGGDIILEGSENIYDLGKLKNSTKYIAGNGQQGGAEQSTGKNGQDIVIKVPIITIATNQSGEELGRIDTKGQQITIANGGRGGLGNYNFRYGQRLTLNKFTPGEAGDEFFITLELRLIADIIFIGFPNAGKSSMLNMLTNADVKTAPYPFTTLEPHLGVSDGTLLMDLPGLIEGSHQGKGLGTKLFKRHTNHTKLIAHFISLESEDLIRDYHKIRNELKEIDETLYNKPEFIILTKSDLYTQAQIESKSEEVSKLGLPFIITSCFDYSKVGEIKAFFQNQLKSHSK